MTDYTSCDNCGYDFPADLSHLGHIDASGILCPECEETRKALLEFVESETTAVMKMYREALGLREKPLTLVIKEAGAA